MNFLIFAAAVLGFFLCVKLTRVVPCVQAAAANARETVAVLSAADIDDARKEAAARSASLAMMAAFFAILLRSVVAFGLPLLAVVACIALGVVTEAEMERAATDPYAILAAALAMILVWKLLK